MYDPEIPLSEYDGDPSAVIRPDHEELGLRFPARAVFAFVGDCADEFAAAEGLEKIAEFENITKKYPVYLGHSKEVEYVLCQAPMGAPAAVQLMDWLMGYGVRTVLSTGSCGVLRDIPENAFLIPVRAMRDEGTSFHYLPPSRFVETDAALRMRVTEGLRRRNLSWEECTVWTTDGFFRETAKKVKARLAEGCACVDMECAALAACAAFRGGAFAQILFTADSLADIARHDERNWGQDSLMPALRLCTELIGEI